MSTQNKASRPGRGSEAGADTNSTGPEYTTRLNAFLPLDLSDFEAKDNALTDVQHLIYIRLVKQFWLTARPLPDVDARLARIARCSTAEWRRHREAVLAFFILAPAGLEPDLYRDHLERAKQVSESRKKAGKSGASARWAKSGSKPGGTRKEPMANAIKNDGERIADTDTDTDTREDLPSSAARGPDSAAAETDFCGPDRLAAARSGGAV